MAPFDPNLVIYLCYLGIGFVAGRIVMSIEFTLLKPKYESYKIINAGENFTNAVSIKKKRDWDIVSISHVLSKDFSQSVIVLDPNYYRELTPQEMTAKYYMSVIGKQP